VKTNQESGEGPRETEVHIGRAEQESRRDTARNEKTREERISKHEQRFVTTRTNAAFVLLIVLNALEEW